MHPDKIKNVLAKDARGRYDYFVSKVADFETVWGLKLDKWVMVADGGGRPAAPFWPEEEFAKLCATDSFAGAVAASIPLDQFLERWLPGLERDGYLVAIFPKPNNQGTLRLPSQLRTDIKCELELYD
ncbi:DUF2750 domain-containing protein [Anatilimnocola floriformis]|uniref:DUF2750 domain-containing protein n=1 Tax=Anatilimnocola floriformis TaxID=2948575 RepID=UPI0020C4505F|nr:DUF2750 domain-containing protein [Anatilimnocola floriformis]